VVPSQTTGKPILMDAADDRPVPPKYPMWRCMLQCTAPGAPAGKRGNGQVDLAIMRRRAAVLSSTTLLAGWFPIAIT